MSVATEISRIQTARNTIRAKAVELGIGTIVDTLDKLATEIEGIENRGAVSRKSRRAIHTPSRRATTTEVVQCPVWLGVETITSRVRVLRLPRFSRT